MTDYDTNYTISGEPVADTGIGIARAREIALQHAGRTAGEVVFVESELGRDDGRLEYEIEFICRSGTNLYRIRLRDRRQHRRDPGYRP